MKEISIYSNKGASGANCLHWQGTIREVLFRYNLHFRETNTLIELKSSLQKDLSTGIDLIIAIGGDGTVHNIIQEIASSDVPVFIIPTGTANDLAQEMGLQRNLKDILNKIKSVKRKKIDLISINGRYMATNGGVGLAAEVANEIDYIRNNFKIFNKAMKLCKGRIYSLMLAKKLLSMKINRYHIHVESPDFPKLDKSVKTPLVLINNQATLGTNFQVAPHTKNTDGKFNVTIFTHKSNVDLIKAIVEIAREKYPHNDENIISFETDELNLTSLNSQHLTFFGDGEIFKKSKDLKIEIRKQALSTFSYNQKSLYNNSYSLDEITAIL